MLHHARASSDRRSPLLNLDPDLADRLSPERRKLAQQELWTWTLDIRKGPWRADSVIRITRGGIGVLVLRGLLVRELRVGDTISAELIAAGDIIAADQSADLLDAVDALARWTALQTTRVALLDAQLTGVLSRFPELTMAAISRVYARAQRLALTQAISQMTGVDRRLEALFWHLADRWGKVTPAGVVVPVPLSHRVLGSLVGARRPTVSTALLELAAAGRISSRPDGWLLTGSPPRAHPGGEGFVAHRAARLAHRADSTARSLSRIS